MLLQERVWEPTGHPLSFASGRDLMLLKSLNNLLKSASSMPVSASKVLGGDTEDDNLKGADEKYPLLLAKDKGESSISD